MAHRVLPTRVMSISKIYFVGCCCVHVILLICLELSCVAEASDKVTIRHGINYQAFREQLPPGPTREDLDTMRAIGEWRTPLYLLFCRGTARVYFRPPPATPNMQLRDMELRLRTESLVSNEGQQHQIWHRKEILLSDLKPVDNVTGLVSVELSDIAFACTHNCKGYRAEAMGLSFSNTYGCLTCKMSYTKLGCIYYPNGTTINTMSRPEQGANYCTQQPSPGVGGQLLTQSDNCTPTKMSPPPPTINPSIIVGMVAAGSASLALCLLAACVAWLLISMVAHWKRANVYSLINDDTNRKIEAALFIVSSGGMVEQHEQAVEDNQTYKAALSTLTG